MKCLQKYAFEELRESDVRRLQEGLHECFASDKRELSTQASCLPLIVGRDAPSDRTVSVRYVCSDICPDLGAVFVQFDGVGSKETCCKSAAHR